MKADDAVEGGLYGRRDDYLRAGGDLKRQNGAITDIYAVIKFEGDFCM